MRRKNLIFGFILLAGLVLIVSGIWASVGGGRITTAQAFPPPAPVTQEGDNALCLSCHSEPDKIMSLPGGENIVISIDPDLYANGVHGRQSMNCTVCHINISGFPHPNIEADTLKEYKLSYQETCATCHNDQFDNLKHSIHGEAINSGNPNAPTCVDCHDPHYQEPMVNESGEIKPVVRAEIPETCAKCHDGIYEEYAQSVHGSGILQDNNPDVPTCTDCHGEHDIADPTTANFRLSSIDTCAKCHTDASIMDKYGLSTEVLNTYVADFHGTTTTLFEEQHPDEFTNKPVCYDCHGTHDIRRVDDPEKGIAVKENLLVTCQKCHPGASMNFPDSWLSHYIPSPDKYPLVYWVGIFYKIFIPAVLGSMGLFVISDFGRRLIQKRKKTSPPPQEEKSDEEVKS